MSLQCGQEYEKNSMTSTFLPVSVGFGLSRRRSSLPSSSQAASPSVDSETSAAIASERAAQDVVFIFFSN
jgi:hypothetical protein